MGISSKRQADRRPTPLGDQCRLFIKELERVLRKVQREAPPECFNFLLKSQAAVIYRLAREAGVADEIAQVTRDGPPE